MLCSLEFGRGDWRSQKRGVESWRWQGGLILQLDGDMLGREAGRGDRGHRKDVAAAQSQIVKAHLT